MKKIISLILVALMITSIVLTVWADGQNEETDKAEGLPFCDVTPYNWYYKYVYYCFDKKLVNGTTSTRFDPMVCATRAQAVTLLWNMEGCPREEGSIVYIRDVKETSWYYEAVKWGFLNGILKGTTSRKFSPNDKITREQIAAMLYRYSEYKGYDVSSSGGSIYRFTDYRRVSTFAANSLNWAIAKGIVQGDDKGKINPRDNVTRGEIATFICRYAMEYTDEQEYEFPDDEPSQHEIEVRKAGSRIVIHGAGTTVDGIICSNSKEALEYSYKEGYRYIEIDFNWTLDSQLICIHDWTQVYSRKEGYTYEEFLEIKNGRYGYNSLTLYDVADFVKAHPDLHIITDVKERNTDAARVIADKYPELRNNFIIQIYNINECKTVDSLGFDNIWITLYNMRYNEKITPSVIRDYVINNPIDAIVFSIDLTAIDGYVSEMGKIGVPLYVHTVNERYKQLEYMKIGIYGIYSDIGIEH